MFSDAPKVLRMPGLTRRKSNDGLDPARRFDFTSNVDEFGWVTGEDGRHHYTTSIYVQGEPEKNFKTGLREVVKVHKGRPQADPNRHIIISDMTDELAKIKTLIWRIQAG